MKRKTNRRDFLQQSTMAGIGFWVAGGVTAAPKQSSSQRPNIACIGVGGKGSSDTDQSAQFASTSYYMPVRKTAADSQVLKDYWAKVPQGKQGFDLIQYSSPEPNIRGQQDIRDVIFNMITEVITGKSTPDAAMKDKFTSKA